MSVLTKEQERRAGFADEHWAGEAIRLSKELAETERSLDAANAAYEMVCEAIMPGTRNGSAAAMSISAKLLHRRADDSERKTAERIAAWLDADADECDTEAAIWVQIVRDYTRKIRKGEWK